MKRILLVRLSAMGDLCQSLGAVQALQSEQPDLELHFVTQTSNVPLLEELGFASVIALDRYGGRRARRDVRRAMRSLQADLAIDLQGNWKSALITRASGAVRRVGAAGSHRQAPASGLLLERIAIEGPRHPAHVATCLLRELLGLKVTSTPTSPRPQLCATDAELAGVDGRLTHLGIEPGRPFDVLVVARHDDNRAWPREYMERQMDRTHGSVLWLLGPAEAAEPLPAGASALVQRAGETRELVALGRRVALSGGRVFGPDVGTTHVMAACGAETYAFFGPQDPERTAPPGAFIVVRSDPPSCVPCQSRRCANPAGPICMEFDASDAHRIR